MKNTNENIKIAVAINAARNILNMSLMDVADYCGVSGTTVSKWEANEMQIRAVTLMQLTKLFRENGVHIDISDDSVNIRVDEDGLKKREKYLSNKTKLRKGETIEADPSSDKYTLTPKVHPRSKRVKKA
jgi:transcriptional regulator with XRE-family HTH domain